MIDQIIDKFNGKVIDKIVNKSNGKTLYEAWKSLLTTGIPPLTLQKCKGVDLVDYKIYGDSIQTLLSFEYQQVEYIEATGTQYFEIDYIANQDTNSKGKFQITDTSKANFLFGARRGAAQGECYGLNWGGGNPYKFYNTYYGNSNDGMTKTSIGDEIHTFEKVTNKLYLDDTLIHTRSDTDGTIEFTTPNKILVFGCNTNGTIGLLTYARIFNLQLYDKDVLKINLIPCYRKSDNVIGMYDSVNNVFYINQGTGEFLKGNDVDTTDIPLTNVLPTPKTPVEIQSVGDKTKNIFDMSKNVKLGTEQGLTIEYSEEEDCLILNGTTTIDNSYGLQNFLIPNIAGTSYGYAFRYVSGTMNKTSDLYASAYFGQSDDGKSKKNWKAIGLRNNEDTTYVSTCNASYIMGFWIYISAGVSFENFKIRIQLQESTEKPTNYEPYGKYKIPVEVSGKNLLVDLTDINNWTYKLNDFIDPDRAYYYYNLTDILPVGETVTFSYKLKESQVPTYFYLTHDDETLPKNGTGKTGNIYTYLTTNKAERLSLTFVPKEGKSYYIGSQLTNNNTSLEAFSAWLSAFEYFQVELGTSVTDYEPYVESIITNIYLNEPLRKCGNYADYVDFKNKMTVRLTESIIFDGSENWEKHTSTTDGSVFRLDNVFNPKFGELVKDTFMTHFQPTQIYTTAEFTSGLYRFTNARDTSLINGTRLYISTVHTSVEELKQWLSENKPELVYFINDEIPNDIELPGIPTCEGRNIIEVNTELLPSNMEVIYKGKK